MQQKSLKIRIQKGEIMTFEEIKLIKNPVEYNQKLDNFLQITNDIPMDVIQEFYSAYNYDTAASMNWLIDKLKIVFKRIKKEGSINIGGNIYNKDIFLNWIKENFPYLLEDIK